MTSPDKRRGGGGKLTRSETVTVRLDPKLRYLAELAALKQRRTLSSFIEWAIEDCLSKVCLREIAGAGSLTVAGQAELLWDVDESDRFVKLALDYPELLTHEEQIRWKLIRENGALWKGWFEGPDDGWVWAVGAQSLIWENLRTYWEDFCAVAKGEASPDILPTWTRTRPMDREKDTD